MKIEVADDHLVAIGASAKNFSAPVAYLFEVVKSQKPTTVSVVVVAVLAFSGASG